MSLTFPSQLIISNSCNLPTNAVPETIVNPLKLQLVSKLCLFLQLKNLVILNDTYHHLLLSLVAATPLGKSKNIARVNSLHHGVVLRDGFFPEEVDSGQLVDKTIMKKGWEPAALYIFGDKSLLRVGLLYHMNGSKLSTAGENNYCLWKRFIAGRRDLSNHAWMSRIQSRRLERNAMFDLKTPMKIPYPNHLRFLPSKSFP